MPRSPGHGTYPGRRRKEGPPLVMMFPCVPCGRDVELGEKGLTDCLRNLTLERIVERYPQRLSAIMLLEPGPEHPHIIPPQGCAVATRLVGCTTSSASLLATVIDSSAEPGKKEDVQQGNTNILSLNTYKRMKIPGKQQMQIVMYVC